MKRERSRQGRWLPLLLMLVLGLLATPVAQSLASPDAGKTTTLDSTVYLTTATLKPLFQKEIDQRVSSTANASITGMTSKMAQKNQGWANKMANALLEPQATVTDMTPQKDGILTTLHIQLYPGDPFPVESKLLVKFSILDPNTIQVSGKHMSGPKLVNDGPLTTLKVSIGRLQSINTTPTCGESALAIKLQFAVSLDMTKSTVPQSTNISPSQPQQGKKPLNNQQQKQSEKVDAYVEVPQPSLDKLAHSIDKLPISNTMRAQNLHVSVQDKLLIMTSDLSLWDTGVIVASTRTTIQPGAKNGKVNFKVNKTDLTVAFFTFDGNSYNKQIETLLNQNLGSALAGKLDVNAATIGNNVHVPCAADNSLMLAGKTSLE